MLHWTGWLSATAVLLLCLKVNPSDLIVSIHRAGNSKLAVASDTSTAGDSIHFSEHEKENTADLYTDSSSEMKSSRTTCENDNCHGFFEDNLLKAQTVAEKLNETSPLISWSTVGLYSLLSASLVGLSGIFPLLVLPNLEEGGNSLQEGKGARNLNRLLSFAVGGLLGDVFLHLLPESWNHLDHIDSEGKHSHLPALTNGLWILFGLISFCFLEKLFPEAPENLETEEKYEKTSDCHWNGAANANENNNRISNGNCKHQDYERPVKNGNLNNTSNGSCPNQLKPAPPQQKIKISGYLNLFANCIDNFTHGLAIGGSYLVSTRVGALTTMAILLHEIPHEVGDFAILLRAGFSRWKAAKLQVLTATGGILGALFALLADSAKGAGDQVAWILPFTSGGFIYIALCTVVPDLLKETSPRESCIQLLLITMAIAVMGVVTLIE